MLANVEKTTTDPEQTLNSMFARDDQLRASENCSL